MPPPPPNPGSARLPALEHRHHSGTRRGSLPFVPHVWLCWKSHLRCNSLRGFRALSGAPELPELLLCPHISLDHASERVSLFRTDLARAGGRKNCGDDTRGIGRPLERRQIDLYRRALARRQHYSPQPGEGLRIFPFRPLDDGANDCLGIDLDELLEQGACLVARAARTTCGIAALPAWKGIFLSPHCQMKKPAMRGIAGQQKPGGVIAGSARTSRACTIHSI
jgi:hypothetical protein